MAKTHNSDKTNFDVYFEEINEMFQPDAAQQFVYLTGAAGTGKTTLVKKIIEENDLKRLLLLLPV